MSEILLQSVLRVSRDDTNFVQVPLTEHQCRLHDASVFPGFVRARYRWGIQVNAGLPQGFVFLKQKDYKKGRSVVAYSNTVTEKVQRGTASAIEQMLHVCFPDRLGTLAPPQIFAKIQGFFSTVPLQEDVRFINDDLIGFFNSVPQVRILEATTVQPIILQGV